MLSLSVSARGLYRIYLVLVTRPPEDVSGRFWSAAVSYPARNVGHWERWRIVGSYSVYKMLRHSAKNGTRLKIHVEWAASRAEAVRCTDEIYGWAYPEVRR